MKFRLIVFIVFFLVLLAGVLLIRPIVGNMMLSVDMSGEEMQQIPDFLKELVSSSMRTENQYKDDQFFLISQWFGKNFGQFSPFLALIIAFPLFARETEKKTIYLLIARRSRAEVFFGKVFSAYSILLILLFSFSLLAPVVMMLSGYKIAFNAELTQVIVQQIVSASFFYFLFVLFSVLFSDQIKPVILGIVLIFAMPFTSMIPFIEWMNLFPYTLGHNILLGNGFDWLKSLVLMLLILVLFFFSKSLFEKKEF
jgi:ABC-type transport system involved in multi-copper enzyme maturation permease subunit